MSKIISLSEKISTESRSQAFKILCLIAPVILTFAIYLTISTKISQARHSILASRSVLVQSLSLGDFVFIRQFTKSIAGDKAILFSGIKDLETKKWRLASEIDGLENREELTGFQIRSYGIAFPILIPLDSSGQFVFYLEYVFYFHELILPLLLSIILSLFIYLMQQRLLSGISRSFTTPVRSLAADIVGLSSQSFKDVEFTTYQKDSKFLEIDLLARELRNQIRTISVQNEKMKEIEILESIRKFSKQVAHDITSPLGALKAVSSSFKTHPEKAQSLLERSVNRIESIIDDLGKDTNSALLKSNQIIFNLKNIIVEIITEKKLEINSKKYSLDLKASGDNWSLSGNPQLISRTLSNLINNSLEACDNNPIIYISLSQDSNKICLEIADNGKGIHSDDIQNIFTYGFTKGKDNGSGTGLWYAKQVVESMNGKIDLKSIPSVGTKILLTFPKHFS